MPPRIDIFNVPAHGHTNPTLPVVAELVRRGAHVRYFTTPEFRAQIEGLGATFVDIAPLLPPDAVRPDSNLFRLADTLLRATESVVATWLPELRRNPPDVIVHDSLCPWGRTLARLLGVPSVGSITTFVLSPAAALSSPALLGEVAGMWVAGAAARQSFRRVAARLRAQHGVSYRSPLSVLSQMGETNVVYTSPTLQPAADQRSGRFSFVGPSLSNTHRPLDFDLKDGVPLVYVSLGTLRNDAPMFYRACLRAFEHEPVQIVLSVGAAVEVAALGPVPPNVTVRRSVPQLAVLARTSVFVTHGGMNSVHEALAFGVPMLVVPQGSDQRLVGERVRAVGAGLLLSARRVTPNLLGERVRRLLSDSRYREASARVGAEALSLGGAARAAKVILACGLAKSVD